MRIRIPAILAALAAGCGHSAASDPGELGLVNAAAFAPHPYFAYELRPNSTVEFGSSTAAKRPMLNATINGGGYRGNAIPPRKTPGSRRVLCLGGSGTFGLGLPDEATYPADLERFLKRTAGLESGPAPERWQVANLGVPGYSSHEIAGAFSLRWLDLDPDAIVIGDLEADSDALLTNGYRDDYGHVRQTWVEKGEESPHRTLASRVVRARPGTAEEQRAALAASDTRAFETNLAFLVDVAAGRGIRPLVLLPVAAEKGTPQGEAIARLRSAAQRVLATRSATAIDDPRDAVARAEVLARALRTFHW